MGPAEFAAGIRCPAPPPRAAQAAPACGAASVRRRVVTGPGRAGPLWVGPLLWRAGTAMGCARTAEDDGSRGGGGVRAGAER
jgi:hypothetical protein